MNRRPALRPAPGPQPVQVRLIGQDAAVRATVAALQRGATCGPPSYRPTRDRTGTLAYLTIVVPPDA